MKKSAYILSELASALFLAAVWSWFFFFCVLIADTQNVRLSGIWPVIAFAVVYAVDRFINRRGMNMLLYVAIQIVLAAAGSAVLELAVSVPKGNLGLRAYMAVFFTITVIICAKTSAGEPSQASLMHRFDIALILGAVMLLMDHFIPQSVLSSCLAVILASLFVTILALTALRTEKNAATGSRSGRVLPFVLLVVITVVAAGIAVFLSGGAGTMTAAVIAAVSWFFGLIGKGISFLWTQWVRFCAWLASLFPEREGGGSEIIEPDKPIDIKPAGEPSRASIAVLYVLTAILIIGLLTLIVLRLMRMRLKKRTGRVLREKDAVRAGGGEAFRAAAAELISKLRYRLDCLRYRNTPAGLLAWCERKAKRRDKKLGSESGSSFILRLAEGRADEEKQALMTLAELVEKSFYSREKANADAALCRAVRRCKF